MRSTRPTAGACSPAPTRSTVPRRNSTEEPSSAASGARAFPRIEPELRVAIDSCRLAPTNVADASERERSSRPVAFERSAESSSDVAGQPDVEREVCGSAGATCFVLGGALLERGVTRGSTLLTIMGFGFLLVALALAAGLRDG